MPGRGGQFVSAHVELVESDASGMGGGSATDIEITDVKMVKGNKAK